MSVYPNPKFNPPKVTYRDQNFVDVILQDVYGCTIMREEFNAYDSRILSVFVKKLLNEEAESILIKPKDVIHLDLFSDSDDLIF